MEAVMPPRYDWSEQGLRDETENPGFFWVLVAVGFAAFLGVLLAINASGPSDCRSIADQTARLHCFDAATQTQPAKGAQIPSH
ncbi:MAG: hypothetical protein JSR72_13560 [Proteobacteria bacterium]|nr:hypothetical protein [Pseudomonadota bacterium]